ncbi:MAG: SDR family oxidoreductase [Chloroflexi bacterium]|nr:SDR family oxidoreductase [Chloroflexota bacterium]
MDLGLRNAKVLVTAASQGLGAATARQFSLEGALVVINSRTLGELQETAAKINAETGNPVYTLASDLTDAEAVAKLVRNAAEMLGGLDILVTNAGGPPNGMFEDFDIEAWQKAAQLSLLSAVGLVRAALPYLRKSKRAAILAVVSASAKQPSKNNTLTNAIRPAVVGLMKTLSQELARDGIRANSILPGSISTGRQTEIMEARAKKNSSTPDEEWERAAADIPMGRFGTPEEFANAAVFLCSPAGGFINGVALPVDGGRIRATM